MNLTDQKVKSLQFYCNSLTEYSRMLTREVQVGNVPLGAHHPIRIQSMTTTDTMDTQATVAQAIRMIEAGCEYVRITAPSVNEARNLAHIKNELHRRGYHTPLVADIHYTPAAAEIAARIVEKVRVNPGNYADKKKFQTITYSDTAYVAELERIRARFIPLVRICKESGAAMRIGTNHGSLSDRIMSRFGDTPLGMVESALEFVRICEEERYYSIVLSMKSSNPQVMVQAYRLLEKKMHEEGMNYPLHLGVTEAGEGEDGRIKSAVGIGTLLEDGLGDTIRVSLTEDPEFEIPVAKRLVDRYVKRAPHKPVVAVNTVTLSNAFSPFSYTRRQSCAVLNIGKNHVPRVVADFSQKAIRTPEVFKSVGYHYHAATDKWTLSDQACDFIYAGKNPVPFEVPGTLGIILDHSVWLRHTSSPHTYPLLDLGKISGTDTLSDTLNFVRADADTFTAEAIRKIGALPHAVLVLETTNTHSMPAQRRAFFELLIRHCEIPVILKRDFAMLSEEELLLHASTDTGALLLDGFGDGIWIHASDKIPLQHINRLSFGILQATRTRISKTEYISCPSCGRTLFNLQETTARIRARTAHLKGVKIGIMGCIVNGPGEMADADYGYVGTGPGKITLYKGKEVVQRNIDSGQAVDALIALIKQYGDWTEPTGEAR